jgi:hypothetical protein
VYDVLCGWRSWPRASPRRSGDNHELGLDSEAVARARVDARGQARRQVHGHEVRPARPSSVRLRNGDRSLHPDNGRDHDLAAAVQCLGGGSRPSARCSPDDLPGAGADDPATRPEPARGARPSRQGPPVDHGVLRGRAARRPAVQLSKQGKLTSQTNKLTWAAKKSGHATNGTGVVVALQPVGLRRQRLDSERRDTVRGRGARQSPLLACRHSNRLTH